MTVRAVGVNHVAFEVDDLDATLDWYARFFDVRLRGRRRRMAWIDLGDQFVALAEGRRQGPDDDRHVGLVVDDKEATRQALADAGAQILPGRGLDFIDPWGNHVQVIDYRDVQFTKAPEVLRGMGLDGVQKRPAAIAELREKGLAGG